MRSGLGCGCALVLLWLVASVSATAWGDLAASLAVVVAVVALVALRARGKHRPRRG